MDEIEAKALREILDLPLAIKDVEERGPLVIQARLLLELGNLERHLERLDEARGNYEEARRLYEQERVGLKGVWLSSSRSSRQPQRGGALAVSGDYSLV